MTEINSLIPVHGGYRKLKSFQVSQLVYDLTLRFCDLYIDKRSRTHDQMVQAARSGVQNIAEGSLASGTSRKTELKLTNVARASLEELRLDYEDFLRQRGNPLLRYDDPIMLRLKEAKCSTVEEFQKWLGDEKNKQENTDEHGLTRTNTDMGRDPKPTSAVLAANGILSLLNMACYFLDRQILRLASDFEKEGGFSERMYRIRAQKKDN